MFLNVDDYSKGVWIDHDIVLVEFSLRVFLICILTH